MGAKEELEEEVPSLSAFELERLENIKRNKEVLESLGLGPGSSVRLQPRVNNSGSSSRGKKRQKVTQIDSPLEVRRSLRNLGKEAPNYVEAPLLSERQPSSSKAGKEDGEEEERVYDLSQLKPRAASEPAPGSSRGIMADLAGIRRFLGKKVPATGKQAVVDLLSPHQRAKFSKYSGVLEWRNAVVLWVNADGGQYDNLFLEGGRHMTWFAGSRCTPETPVVQRLLRGAADKEEEGAEEKEEEQILLFCRNNGEPYVFLGRVGVVEYELRRHPIKVIWRLADFDAVRDQPDFHEVSKGISAS